MVSKEKILSGEARDATVILDIHYAESDTSRIWMATIGTFFRLRT